ncbi:hypothetical protein BDW72DRAFT_182876 [Aspergillus terricola var. indicus]
MEWRTTASQILTGDRQFKLSMVLWYVTHCLLLADLGPMAMPEPRYSHCSKSKSETLKRPLSPTLKYTIGVAAEI